MTYVGQIFFRNLDGVNNKDVWRDLYEGVAAFLGWRYALTADAYDPLCLLMTVEYDDLDGVQARLTEVVDALKALGATPLRVGILGSYP